jgi:peptidyl-prolyl cis-trans isomerase D
MLTALREASKSWTGKVIFAILLLLMIVGLGNWGVGYVSVNFGANQLARVGNTDIAIDAYHRAYQRALQNLQMQLRQGLTDAQARQFGLDRQVLSQLVSETVLDQEAKSLGLAMSDKDLARSIIADNRFKGPGGTFDRRGFERLWRDNGPTEDYFRRELRREYLRREQTISLQQGLAVPTAMLEAMNRYANETRSIDYFVLPAAAVGDIEAPSEEALNAFFGVRHDMYRKPEYRKVVILALTPAALAETIVVTDADVEKRYQELKATRYSEPEKRKLQQILLPDEAAAEAAYAKIAEGATFAQVAADNKLTDKDIDLGTLTRTQLVDKAVAEAAFSLAAGTVSKPVKTQFGQWALLRVTDIVAAQEKPLADVKSDIEKDLKQAKARQELGKVRDAIERARDAGKALAKAAEGTGLTLRTADTMDASGRDADGKPIADLPDAQALIKAIFASDVGVDNEPLIGRDGSTTWFEIVSIDRARQQTLDDVKPLVEHAWREDERGKRLAAKAAELVKRLKGGEKLEALAASEGNLQVMHNGDIKRSGAAGFSQNAIIQIFNVNVGEAGSASDEAGGRLVFQVLDAAVPPLDATSPDFVKLAEQVKSTLGNDLAGEYLTDLQDRMGVSFNQRALRTVLGGEAETQ